MRRTFALLFLFSLTACTQSPYDTSTPEKLVASMGLIGQQPETADPLPYFYEKEAATAIAQFDRLGAQGLAAFDKFRDLVAMKFPKYVQRNRTGMLKVTLDGFNGLKVRTFTFSASTIGGQLKERQPSDYEFIAATEPDEDGIAQLTMKILGNEKTLPLIKTSAGFKIYMEEKAMDNIKASIDQLGQLEQVFVNANQLLEAGDITEENFEDKMEVILLEYRDALK